MALSLGPIRIAKRQWKKPWSSDPFGQEDYHDPEKRAFIEDDDSDNEESLTSRETSYSLDPMLPNSSPTRHMVSAYEDRAPRRKFHLYYSLGLASIAILFILGLTRLGQNSARRLETASPARKAWPYESFPFLKRYHGGIRTLVSRSENVPEYPGDEEELRKDLIDSSGNLQRRQIPEEETKHNLPPMKVFDPFTESDPERQECFLDASSTTRIPKLKAFNGCVKGFPDNAIGSYDIFGLRNDVCFDRFGRLGPYGYGYSEKYGGTGAGLEGDTEDSEQVWAETPHVDYRSVSWSDAQARCADINNGRFLRNFNDSGLHPSRIGTNGQDSVQNAASAAVVRQESSTPTQGRGRTAIVIRTWDDFNYDEEDILYLRALIAEASLASGSEYVVHFLIHVRNNDLPIWTNTTEYQRVLSKSLPEEFAGMGTLWTDAQLQRVYPAMDAHPFRNIHLHGAYRSIYMAMQLFAEKHQDFDFYWHWEMDIRYTGHFYHLFDRLGNWAKQQPRKGLWERNARYYVPSVHGSWEDFRQMVRVQTEHGTSSKANMWSSNSPSSDPNDPSATSEKPIWGPERPLYDELDTSDDPIPPTTHAKDNYEWGLGEEADLISLNPLFDPQDTDWNLERDVTGYNITDGVFPPRRTAIIAAGRLSRRLLLTMHKETSIHKHSMFSEMWPASCALHHGLKAVYAPHPIFIDRRWPTDYMAAVFNAGKNGATGGSRTTIFNDAHQDQLLGITWYYHAGFPANLWKRWLGFKVDGDGGPSSEILNEGRMCLPGTLLHPIKQVDLVKEKPPAREEKVDFEKGHLGT